MNIDTLIRDLIEEDQFNEKYTKRQRSIFCKNMYSKLSAFISERDRLHAIETNKRLEEYRVSCEEYMNKSNEYLVLNLFYRGLCVIVMLYVYYNFTCNPPSNREETESF